MNRFYNIVQWTWALPQTLAGRVLYAAHRKCEHRDYMGARVTYWDRDDGVSLGKYVFVPTHDDDETMLRHEYGHTVQSMMLGPAYLVLIGLPSLLWNRLPFFEKRRQRSGKAYDSILIEKTATSLGERRTAKTKERYADTGRVSKENGKRS